MKFQADADLNQKIVSGVKRRERAIDLLDAHEGGIIGLPDLEVLRLSHDANTMPKHR